MPGHGLGTLAGKSSVANADVATDAAIATSKLSGPLTDVSGHGLGALAARSSVTDADVAANAAIAGTKVTPDFGSQNLQTGGRIGVGVAPGFPLHVAANEEGGYAGVFEAAEGEARIAVRGAGVQDQIELNAWPGYAMLQTGKTEPQPLQISSKNFSIDGETAVRINGEYTLVLTGTSNTGETWSTDIEIGEGNLFLELRAAFSHCGGGCHGAYLRWSGFLNVYMETQTVENVPVNFGSGGTWEMKRIATHVNSDQTASRVLRLTKTAGPSNYGGQINIRITANKPMKVLSRTN